MGVNELASAIKSAVDKRISEESRAKRGVIKDGMFYNGTKSYPFQQAVDCNVANGRRVWAQLSSQGAAVIIGA